MESNEKLEVGELQLLSVWSSCSLKLIDFGFLLMIMKCRQTKVSKERRSEIWNTSTSPWIFCNQRRFSPMSLVSPRHPSSRRVSMIRRPFGGRNSEEVEECFILKKRNVICKNSSNFFGVLWEFFFGGLVDSWGYLPNEDVKSMICTAFSVRAPHRSSLFPSIMDVNTSNVCMYIHVYIKKFRFQKSWQWLLHCTIHISSYIHIVWSLVQLLESVELGWYWNRPGWERYRVRWGGACKIPIATLWYTAVT